MSARIVKSGGPGPGDVLRHFIGKTKKGTDKTSDEDILKKYLRYNEQSKRKPKKGDK